MAVSVGIFGPQIVSLQSGNDCSSTLIRGVAAVNQLVIPGGTPSANTRRTHANDLTHQLEADHGLVVSLD